MKALKCEMCGMNQLVKKDGMYVCEYCGTQYTIEEAEKLMVEIEGTVDVKGTVKVDTSDKLSKLYQVARRAKEENNIETAAKYFDMILQEDPDSWEAQFYTVYYQAMRCKIANIDSVAVSVTNCEDTVFNLIKDNVTDSTERKKAVDEVTAKLIDIAIMIFNVTINDYLPIKYQMRAKYRQEVLNPLYATKDILYTAGNLIIDLFGDEYGLSCAVPCWEAGVQQHSMLVPYCEDKEGSKNLFMSYVDKIKNFKEDYQSPEIKEIKTRGCYVATCVYGSYDCPEVWTLRRYRDDTLGATWYGRAFIRTYYAISPTLVKWFGHTNWFKKMWRGKLNRMVTKLQNKGVENTPYDDKDWRK